jgi:hypothetical protein
LCEQTVPELSHVPEFRQQAACLPLQHGQPLVNAETASQHD